MTATGRMGETSARDEHLLPGEDRPLAMRPGGQPITPDEALGVARRMARENQARGRKLTHLDLPDELPSPEARLIPAAYRLPPRTLMFVRAKAEMEGRTVTEVITEALEAYAVSSPGAKPVYRTSRR